MNSPQISKRMTLFLCCYMYQCCTRGHSQTPQNPSPWLSVDFSRAPSLLQVAHVVYKRPLRNKNKYILGNLWTSFKMIFFKRSWGTLEEVLRKISAEIPWRLIGIISGEVFIEIHLQECILKRYQEEYLERL